jgi:peroxiredoxin
MAVGVGDPAPAFTLPDERCEQVRLPGGATPLVLVFYRGDW